MKDFFHQNITISVIGYIAGILAATSMLPQLVTTIRKKKAGDVSPLMLIVLLAGLGCWILYGALKNDLPVMLTNSFSFLLNLAMLFLRFKYRR